MEVHRSDWADLVGEHQLLQADVSWCIAHVEADGDLAVVALLGVEHRAALGLVGRHRLLGDDVDALVEGADDVVGVVGIDGGHGEQVGFGFGHHAVEVGVDGARRADETAHDLGPLAVRIAETDELHRVAPLLRDASAPHARPARPGANDGVAAFAWLGREQRGEGRGDRRGGSRGGGGGQEVSAVHAPNNTTGRGVTVCSPRSTVHSPRGLPRTRCRRGVPIHVALAGSRGALVSRRRVCGRAKARHCRRVVRCRRRASREDRLGAFRRGASSGRAATTDARGVHPSGAGSRPSPRCPGQGRTWTNALRGRGFAGPGRTDSPSARLCMRHARRLAHW